MLSRDATTALVLVGFKAGAVTALFINSLDSAGKGIGPMTGSLAQISSTVGEPREISTNAEFAEYEVLKVTGGTTRACFVVFYREGDRWRLDSF